MTAAVASSPTLDALDQRLGAVAPALGVDVSAVGSSVADLLHSVVDAVRAEPAVERVWLLLVAVTATFPTGDQVLALRRRFPFDRPADLVQLLLHDAVADLRQHGAGRRTIEVVTDRVVVDVDFSAKDDLHTGIQRVVRHVAPRWVRDRDVEPVVWTATAGAYRRPTESERARVLRWGTAAASRGGRAESGPIVVPWRTTVVLPEVPGYDQMERITALAQYSGNRVVAVGYDCIPIVAADLVSDRDSARFTRYLTLIKHCALVVAISRAVGAEFEGFRRALVAQGLDGPAVDVCTLGVDTPPAGATPDLADPPEVLVVGSFDRRKNQLAVLHAADVLWSEGLRFAVRLAGNPGWGSDAVYREAERLRSAGHPVSIARGVDDDSLWAMYQRAAFTVFPSLQEGYGLPVVESLSFGTPVITGTYGSVAEVAAGGGALLVDPRRDDELVDAMRTLLTRPERRDELADEARSRQFRSWDDYADALWDSVEATCERS